MRKRILFAALFALLSCMAFAQTKTSLSVQCSQGGAGVYLNDNLIGYTSPNFSALVLPGEYSVRVSKTGFADFRTTVIIGRSPITILATLGGPASPGWTPPFQPIPSPPGLKSSMSIDSNVAGAKVYLNGSFAGATPFFAFLNPGIYSIVVSHEGYEDYTSTVRLSDRYQLHATLAPKPRLVDYEIKIPEYFAAKQEKSGKFSAFEIYMDGKRLQSTPATGRPGIGHRRRRTAR